MRIRVCDGCGPFAVGPTGRGVPGDIVELADELCPRFFWEGDSSGGAAVRYVAFIREQYGEGAIEVLDDGKRKRKAPRAPSAVDLEAYPWRVRLRAARSLGTAKKKKASVDAFLREQDPEAVISALAEADT